MKASEMAATDWQAILDRLGPALKQIALVVIQYLLQQQAAQAACPDDCCTLGEEGKKLLQLSHDDQHEALKKVCCSLCKTHKLAEAAGVELTCDE